METTRKRRIFRLIAFVLPAFLIVFAGLVLGVRELWNWLMPDIFGLRTITYWQALGLMVLSWFLFRGFRGPQFYRDPWARGMRERWRRMTPAERGEFTKGLRSRWCETTPAETDPKA